MQMPIALVAAHDEDWRTLFRETLERNGCVVFSTGDGLEGMQLMKERVYDIVVVDESLDGAGQVEFVLSIRDLAPTNPVVLVAGSNVERFDRVWQQRDVSFAAARSCIAKKIPDAVRAARSRLEEQAVGE